jgi:hypothetical protein
VTDDHLSLDELAELDEGLLPPERISAIRAHLHGCEECGARAKAITSTRSMLADLPAVTMPADVVARLGRAIAEEAGQTGEEAGQTGEEAGHTAEEAGQTAETAAIVAPPIDPAPINPGARSADVTPHLATVVRPRFGRPTMAASAAAAAVVLAFGAIIYAHYHHNGGAPVGGAQNAGAPSGVSAAAGRAQPKNFVETSTGENYTPANLSTLIPGLIATSTTAGNVPAPAQAPSTGAGPAAGSGSGVAGGQGSSSGGTASGSKHGAAQSGKKTALSPLAAATPLRAPVPQRLVTQPVPASLQSLYHSRQKLLHCAAFLGRARDAVPLAIDFGRWTNGSLHDAPSVVFVFRDPDPSVVDVYVTGPSCDDGTVRTYVKVPTG